MHLVGEFASMQVVVVVCPSLRPAAVAKEGRGEGGEGRLCVFAYEAGGRGYHVRSPDSVRGHTFGHTHTDGEKGDFCFSNSYCRTVFSTKLVVSHARLM